MFNLSRPKQIKIEPEIEVIKIGNRLVKKTRSAENKTNWHVLDIVNLVMNIGLWIAFFWLLARL